MKFYRMPTAHVSLAVIAACSASVGAMAADPAPFDLVGPELSIQVTRAGRTLPIGQVPALATGDVVRIEAKLPEDQSVRYRLVSAFLRGVTNPPPKQWIDNAETWRDKEKKRVLKLTVPSNARQLILFMAPDTGGDIGAISDAVRGKPGEFVRVTQDINQASLDRSRLNAFVAGIRSQENSHPEFLKTVAPILSSSLAVRLNPECMAKVVEFQAACLLENRDSLVLGDIHSSSLTETIIGAPTDLAMQLSATREGGYGFYSPYIGVVRDLARIFGAFNNPEFNYLPALGIQQGSAISLLLNSAPSFRKPKSVLVAAMPAIEKNVPPPLRRSNDEAICATRPGILFGVEGAPLIYATGYAHDMALRFTDKDGRTMDVPVAARADRGGYVLASPIKATEFGGAASAQLRGFWGFDAFEGPEFLVQLPGASDWKADAAERLIVGRDSRLLVKGSSPLCVENVSVQLPGGQSRPVPWRVSGTGGISIDMPLAGATAGDATISIQSFGGGQPDNFVARIEAPMPDPSPGTEE